MVIPWWSYRRKDEPNANTRLNKTEIDFNSVYRKCTVTEALVSAVNSITTVHPGPYTLYVSGGVDSQVMIYGWHLSGRIFKAVHYSYGSNEDELDTLVKFCASLGVPIEIRHFNARQFITSPELVKYAKMYDCTSPHILTYIKLVEQEPDEHCVVMAGNFIGLNTCGLNYTILGLDRFRKISRPNFVPFFLLSTPELAYAFRDKEMRKLHERFSERNKDLQKSFYTIKCEIYKESELPIIPQNDKLTGFERIKESFDSHPVSFYLKCKYAPMPSRRPFDLLFRYALHDEVGAFEDQIEVNLYTNEVIDYE